MVTYKLERTLEKVEDVLRSENEYELLERVYQQTRKDLTRMPDTMSKMRSGLFRLRACKLIDGLSLVDRWNIFMMKNSDKYRHQMLALKIVIEKRRTQWKDVGKKGEK